MILDTIMDALNSVFPNLIQAPGGSESSLPAGRAGSAGDSRAEGTFAATLLALLGGRGEGVSAPIPPEGEAVQDLAAELGGENQSGEMGEGGGEDTDGEFSGRPEHQGRGRPFQGDWALPPTGAASPHGRPFTHARGEEGGSLGAKTQRAGVRDGVSAVHSREGGSEPSILPDAPSGEGEAGDGPQPTGVGSGTAAPGGQGLEAPERADPVSLLARERASYQAPRPPSSTPDDAPGASLRPASGPVGLETPEEGGAATEAVAATAPSATAGAGSVIRDTDRLDPQFRERLDRVIQRMEGEFGHTVQVTETYRSPDRQEALFAQGRTEPGPVVTWTRDSLHSRGRAADVRVDESWENPQGYARLQRIAREEGLQTLGSRDPGHLELPESGVKGRRTESDRQEEFLRESRIARVARTARVAGPASVATPAQVASVARPPRPGSHTAVNSQPPEKPGSQEHANPVFARREGGASTAGHEDAVVRPTAMAAGGGSATGAPRQERGPGSERSLGSMAADARFAGAQEPAPGSHGLHGSAEKRSERRARDGSVETGSRGSAPAQEGSPTTWEGQTTPQVGKINSGSPVNGPQAAGGPAAPGVASRVHEIQALEEVLNARAPGRIHLDLQNADGAGTRLRLALRGGELAGSVDVSDPVATQRMRARIGELHEALTRQGLDARALAVQGVKGAESRGVQADLASLLQDPLAGLARMLDAREGAPGGRGQRGGQGGETDRDPSGRSSNDANRRNRSKEEQR